jgi:DNA-binding NarL/FixJ family response regulator
MHEKSLYNRGPTARHSALEGSGSDVIRIAVFDENPLFRAGIVHVLNAEPGLEVVAASDIFSLGMTPLPDVVILDSNIVSKLCLERSFSGLRSSVKVLVLALSVDEEQFLAAFAAGARGYLLKGVDGPQLVEAVHALHRGEGCVSPSLAAIMLIQPLAKRGQRPSTRLLAQLTFREGEILKLLTAGLTNWEIGRRLDVTEKTIKRDFTRIFEKLDVRNRVEAAMLLRPGPQPQIVQRDDVITWSPVDVRREAAAGAVSGVPGKAKGKSPPRGNGQGPSG